MTNIDFQRLLDAALASRQADPVGHEMADKINVSEVFRSLTTGTRVSGAAREVHEELCRAQGLHPDSVSGTMLPFGAMLPRGFRRDLNAGTFSQGGATVQTTIGEPIQLLLNRATAQRCGATVISGLRGNVALPRVTSAPEPETLPESGTATKSGATFDQVSLVPHKITVTVDVTRQLILQSSQSTENFLRNLMGDMIALKTDRLFYYGQGAGSEPQGIVNTPGVGSVTFGGAATYDKLVDFEGSLSGSNADVTGAKMAYVTSPAVRTKLKKAAKLLVGATTVAATPIWEKGNWGDDSGDGMVNDFRAAASNQISNNQVIYGNFADSIIGIFGNGVEMLANPYSRDVDAVVRFTMHLFADIALRHAVSFCVSADSGAQ